MNYSEVEEYILGIPKFSKKTSKENLLNIYNKLNIRTGGIIHVAGTNGKGSVCAYVSSILIKAGKKVGTFTSPHLVTMTERIRINGKDVSKEKFVEAFLKVKDAVDETEKDGGEHPSFFEILFLMAMYVFSAEETEYIVLETGLGGKLDATNMFEKPLVSVITSVSMDHMEILGDTLEKIAGEKAGIIKKNIPVVYYGENPVVGKVIEDRAKSLSSPEFPVVKADILSIKKYKNNIAFSMNNGYYVYGDIDIPFIAEYQIINALLAIKTIEVLVSCYGADIKREDVLTGIKEAKWEARMEQILPGVFLDGAHNDEGVEAFVNTVSGYEPTGKKIVVFAAVQEKEYEKMIKRIATETGATDFVVTTINNTRALPADIVADVFERYADKNHVHRCKTTDEALKTAFSMQQPDDTVFIVGSLYLAGEVKQSLTL